MKSEALKLFRAAVGAVDPYVCVKHQLRLRAVAGNEEKKELHIGEQSVALNRNLYVAAFGKAALGTAHRANRACNDRLSQACVER